VPQISPKEFYALPLRVHAFLANVPLHDVWAVDLPRQSSRVTLAEFHRRPRKANAGRLTQEDRDRSSVEAGTRDGAFHFIYRFENEQLVELQNRTAHAAALSALAETADGYRYYFAVYVANVSWFTPIYMALIDPFRKWIVYPALLKNIRATWLEST